MKARSAAIREILPRISLRSMLATVLFSRAKSREAPMDQPNPNFAGHRHVRFRPERK